MLQMFGGVDQATLANLGEMWKAIRDTFLVFKNIYIMINKRKMEIVLLFTFVWMLSAALPHILHKFHSLK